MKGSTNNKGIYLCRQAFWNYDAATPACKRPQAGEIGSILCRPAWSLTFGGAESEMSAWGLSANPLQPFNSTERITGLIKQAEEKSLLLLEREGKLLCAIGHMLNQMQQYESRSSFSTCMRQRLGPWINPASTSQLLHLAHIAVQLPMLMCPLALKWNCWNVTPNW